MIIVDPRNGAEKYNLVPLLKGMGCEVVSQQMDFGDVAFCGNGPNGSAISVGIEIKRSDLLPSIASGNLRDHQIPGLNASFDCVWLLIEGRYRSGPGGILQIANERPWKDAAIVNWNDAGHGARRWTYREIEARLLSWQLMTGVRVMRTDDLHDTAAVIAAMHDWFTTEQWEGHTSHVPVAMKATLDGRAVRLVPPSMASRVAAQFPGCGSTLASMAGSHFESVQAMCNAEPAEWRKLPGIGLKTATDIVRAIRGTTAVKGGNSAD